MEGKNLSKNFWSYSNFVCKAQTSYSWLVEVQPDQSNSGTQNIVLKINEGSKVVVDATISDVGGLAGGRMGVYCQSQQDVIWSRMTTECI